MVSFTSVLASALAALPLVQGIQFNAVPSANTGSSVTVTWSTVDTDPSIFSLYLWNFGIFPPYYAPLAFGVNTTAGTTAVRIPCDIPGASGSYQFSAINGTNVYVIYAQTPNFTVSDTGCKDTTASSTCAAKTVTVAPPGCTYVANATTTKTHSPSSTGAGSTPNKTIATVTASHTPTTVVTAGASPLTISWLTAAAGLIACLAVL